MSEGRALLQVGVSRDLAAKLLAWAHRSKAGRGGTLDQKPRLLRLAAIGSAAEWYRRQP